MPMVATGEQNYPVITTTDIAEILEKDAAESDRGGRGTITAHTISPHRLQRSYLYPPRGCSPFWVASRKHYGPTCRWQYPICSTRK